MRRTVLACLFILFCLTPVWGQSAREKKATIEYLRNLQVKGGTFAPAPEGMQSLRATSSALRALKYFGGEARDRAACVEFVKGCFDRDSGGFTDFPGKGKPDVFTTNFATGPM